MTNFAFPFRDYAHKGGPSSWAGVEKAWLGDRLIYDAAGDGAWPRVLINPPVGWDERDAKGV